MKLINLTAHAVVIETLAGRLTIPPSGQVTRRLVNLAPAGQVEVGLLVDVYASTTGDPQGLPAAADGIGYIVSQMVAAAAPLRRDLYFPHDLVRDDSGAVVAARALGQVSPPPRYAADHAVSAAWTANDLLVAGLTHLDWCS